MIPHHRIAEFKEDLAKVVNKNNVDGNFGAHDFVIADAILFLMSRPSFANAVTALELAYRADLSLEDREVYDQVYGNHERQYALPDDAEVQE